MRNDGPVDEDIATGILERSSSCGAVKVPYQMLFPLSIKALAGLCTSEPDINI